MLEERDDSSQCGALTFATKTKTFRQTTFRQTTFRQTTYYNKKKKGGAQLCV